MEKLAKSLEDDFDHFWESYPPRKGDKARQPAKVLFEKAVKEGFSPTTIIDAAKKFSASEKENHNTPFIMQAQKWLRNKRWLDYQPEPWQPGKPDPTSVFVEEGTPQWTAWQKVKKTPCVNFGWWFPSEWPPEGGSHG